MRWGGDHELIDY